MPKRKSLSVVSGDRPEGLGLETIMDRELVARFGVPYVHLAAFAIDIDRINAELGEGPDWPLGWEVFLTEDYLVARYDPARTEDRELVADACASAMEKRQALGAQLAFAVWDAVERGSLPAELRSLFRPWKGRPAELAEALAELWRDAEDRRRSLAKACLESAIEPPLAPPTRQALEAMTRGGASPR